MSSVRRDRGAADALALVLIAPAVIGLAVLVVMLGRSVDSRAQAQSAAEAAAQAAALERSPGAAESQKYMKFYRTQKFFWLKSHTELRILKPSTRSSATAST